MLVSLRACHLAAIDLTPPVTISSSSSLLFCLLLFNANEDLSSFKSWVTDVIESRLSSETEKDSVRFVGTLSRANCLFKTTLPLLFATEAEPVTELVEVEVTLLLVVLGMFDFLLDRLVLFFSGVDESDMAKLLALLPTLFFSRSDTSICITPPKGGFDLDGWWVLGMHFRLGEELSLISVSDLRDDLLERSKIAQKIIKHQLKSYTQSF